MIEGLRFSDILRELNKSSLGFKAQVEPIFSVDFNRYSETLNKQEIRLPQAASPRESTKFSKEDSSTVD